MRRHRNPTLVRYKGVVFDSKDHPEGLATLVIAPECYHGCNNCVNSHLKDNKVQITSVNFLIDFILGNSLGNRIVLGGLEWTEDELNLYVILSGLVKKEANIILYTHWDEETFAEKYSQFLKYDMWIKYGEYREDLKSNDYYSHGVPLASTNQYIKRNVVDKKP